jgi:hypothetical protein
MGRNYRIQDEKFYEAEDVEAWSSKSGGFNKLGRGFTTMVGIFLFTSRFLLMCFVLKSSFYSFLFSFLIIVFKKNLTYKNHLTKIHTYS